MGLDMYAHRISGATIKKYEEDNQVKLDSLSTGLPESKDAESFFEGFFAKTTFSDVSLAYWRKHPNLHGWMQQKWALESGDTNPSNFNYVNLELTSGLLDELEVAISKDALPITEGFFFGKSVGDDEERAFDLEFVKNAKEAIAAGDRVIYTSWW